MSLDINFEYLNGINDLQELYAVEKVVRLEKGQLNMIENHIKRCITRLKDSSKNKEPIN